MVWPNALARHFQAQVIQARERAQVGAIKDSIGHVEVFRMDGVGTPIIGRPRPLPGHDTPNPTQHPYTLNYEEPQIGPDGILVRPAEHAASTYTKPELPEEAKENTERGAEAAAEYYLAVATYAWNTGDTAYLTELSDPESGFARSLIQKINNDYVNGWTFGHTLTIEHVYILESVPTNGADVTEHTIGMKFSARAVDGTKCIGQKIVTRNDEYQTTISILMTWRDGHWIQTQGRAESREN